MLKVAILDDYQNISQGFVDLKKLSGKYEFKIFSEPFLNEDDANKRIFGTAAVVCRCVQAKVSMVRVHDVSSISDTLLMAKRLWPNDQ